MSPHHGPQTGCHRRLASSFVGPWIALARRSRYEPAELRQRMGLLAQPPEWFGGLVFGGPVQQWLHLARVWDAAATVVEGRSQSETELALRIPDGPRFWTWSPQSVDITGGLPDQIIRVQRATCQPRRPVLAAACGRALSPRELPAASRRPLVRLSALCHRNGTGGEQRPQSRRCPFAAECLHSRLRSGVERARETIAALALQDNGLRACLQAKWPLADQHLVLEAIESATLDFLADPCRFDPRRGTELAHFLAGAALRHLHDLQRSERRHKQWLVSLADAPLPRAADAAGTGPSPCDLLLAAEAGTDAERTRAWREQLLASVARRLSPSDRAVLRLMLHGQRNHRPYARVLGITDQPDSVQSQTVNQAKHRLHELLKRLAHARGTGPVPK